MVKTYKLLILLLLPVLGMAQAGQLEKLKGKLKIALTDSARFVALYRVADYYLESNSDSALKYFNRAYVIANANHKTLDEALALTGQGHELIHLGKFPESFARLQVAFNILEKQTEGNSWYQTRNYKPDAMRRWILEHTHGISGILMDVTNNKEQEIIEYQKAIAIATQLNDLSGLGFNELHLGQGYIDLLRLDSALFFEKRAQNIFNQTGEKENLGYVYRCIGQIYQLNGNKKLALQNFREAAKEDYEQKNDRFLSNDFVGLTNFYLAEKQKDSSLFYAKKTMVSLKSFKALKNEDYALTNLYRSYELVGNKDSAYKYLELALAARDRSFKSTSNSLAEFQKLSFKSQLQAQQLEKEKDAIQSRNRTVFLSVIIVVFVLLTGIFYRNNRQKHKANAVLANTLAELKSTQSQLIQSEKMASLGELTAGIAHEIQNPLNFVNNFSDVNREMLTELQEELEKGDIVEAKAIAADIEQNEQKINHHGKRAEAIVKGMLEHSRSSTGQKELTDINQLADEYIRLSYHGLRAKDKSFNAELITNFNSALPKVNAIPQDIGRVLLNLFNNAFYAVNQKAKTAGVDYKPEVSVTTSTENGQVVIKVKDNGIGIPDAIKEKIMQPFFTTKPTGEGTGLGLSLTYDMVVKGHGGSIKVSSKEGEGTEFIVSLPIC